MQCVVGGIQSRPGSVERPVSTGLPPLLLPPKVILGIGNKRKLPLVSVHFNIVVLPSV